MSTVPKALVVQRHGDGAAAGVVQPGDHLAGLSTVLLLTPALGFRRAQGGLGLLGFLGLRRSCFARSRARSSWTSETS